MVFPAGNCIWATLDVHGADQVLVYLSLRHLAISNQIILISRRRTAWLLKQFLPVSFQVFQAGQLICVTAEPSLD